MPPLNALNEQEVNAWKVRLTEALVDLRESRIPFIEGVLTVLGIANETRKRDADFDLFVAIASETDHLPPERARAQCTKEWLAQCDREAEEVHAFYCEAIQVQIAQILVKLEG